MATLLGLLHHSAKVPRLATRLGKKIGLLPVPSASPAKAGVYRSAARAGAHWLGIAILPKPEAGDPWIPAFAGNA